MEKLTKSQESIVDQIIKLIKINRISTTEVADCMGKSGLFADAMPIQQGMFKVGKVRWMYAYNDSNWTIHEIAREIEPGEIVMIESFNCGERSTIGELVSKYMLLYQQAEAIKTCVMPIVCLESAFQFGVRDFHRLAVSIRSAQNRLIQRSIRSIMSVIREALLSVMIVVLSLSRRSCRLRSFIKNWLQLRSRRIFGLTVWITESGIPLISYA